jgi:hypothetical protein
VEGHNVASTPPTLVKQGRGEGLDHYPRLQGYTTCEEKERWRTRQRNTRLIVGKTNGSFFLKMFLSKIFFTGKN